MKVRFDYMRVTLYVNGELKIFAISGITTRKELNHYLEENGYNDFKVLDVEKIKNQEVEIDTTNAYEVITKINDKAINNYMYFRQGLKMVDLKTIIKTLENCVKMLNKLDEHSEMISNEFNVKYAPTFDKEDIINYIVEEILICDCKGDK